MHLISSREIITKIAKNFLNIQFIKYFLHINSQSLKLETVKGNSDQGTSFNLQELIYAPGDITGTQFTETHLFYKGEYNRKISSNIKSTFRKSPKTNHRIKDTQVNFPQKIELWHMFKSYKWLSSYVWCHSLTERAKGTLPSSFPNKSNQNK